MSKNLKMVKQENIKRTILDTACQIILKDGFKGLSVRKITKNIGYSPSIIYHYFKNKEDIINQLNEEGFQKIIDCIKSTERNEEYPQKELEEALRKYIKTALENPKFYLAVMLSDNKEILKSTSVLYEGVSKNNIAFKMLCGNLRRGIEKKIYRDTHVEQTAQVLWTSLFGFIVRLITEGVEEKRADLLTEEYLKFVIGGITNKRD